MKPIKLSEEDYQSLIVNGEVVPGDTPNIYFMVGRIYKVINVADEGQKAYVKCTQSSPTFNLRLVAKSGDRLLVWDSDAYLASGGDVGDNSIFYSPATVTDVWVHNNEIVLDVEFDNGRTVAGMYLTSTKPITEHV